MGTVTVVAGVLVAGAPVDVPVALAEIAGYSLDREALAEGLEAVSSGMLWVGAGATATGTVGASIAKDQLEPEDCGPSLVESAADIAEYEFSLTSASIGELEGDPSTSELEESLWDFAGSMGNAVPDVTKGGKIIGGS